MKHLLVSAFTLWAYTSYSQSANNFANIPVRTENSYPFSATPKFQGTNTISQGLGIFFNFKEDTLAMLLDHVSEKSLKKNLLFLAGDKCQGCTAGTNGDSIAADFVNQWMEKHKLLQQLPVPLKQMINFTDNITIAEGCDKKTGYIIFIAHRNHTMQIFDSSLYSEDDNANGTVALMECAKAIAALSKEGIYPKRSIIFICTTDKDQGFLSSDYFSQHLMTSSSKIKFDLNIDMLSRRIDSNRAGKNYRYSLYYDSAYNSKNIAKNVNQKNTPATTPDKKNYKLLTQKTKLALDVLWKLANE